MSIEGTANTEYASLSGKIRTFVIDKSLTISGACADAKATGDAIETKAGEAAKDAVSEQLPAAVTAGVIAELPKFLDDTLTKPDKAAQAAVVGALLSDKAKIAVGEYSGTGVYGEENPNSLTLPFKPVFMWLYKGGGGDMRSIASGSGGLLLDQVFVAYGAAKAMLAHTYSGSTQSATITFTWDDKQVRWYASHVSAPASSYGQYAQLNATGATYNYIAIG